MDEIAAARFNRADKDFDGMNPPSVDEVLNAALKSATDKPGFSEVIVLLNDPEKEHLVFLGNIPSAVRALGLLSLANRGLH